MDLGKLIHILVDLLFDGLDHNGVIVPGEQREDRPIYGLIVPKSAVLINEAGFMKNWGG